MFQQLTGLFFFTFPAASTLQGLVSLDHLTKTAKMYLLRENMGQASRYVFYDAGCFLLKIENASCYIREERNEELLQEDLGEIVFFK